MFLKNFDDLIDKGVDIGPLMDSHVFNYNIIFDEWPETHSCSEVCFKPYSDSFFNLRESYRSVFPEDKFEYDHLKKHKGKFHISSIQYNLNFLPQLDKHVIT